MDSAHSFAGRFFRADFNRCVIVLHGQPGCGKTHILRKLREFARAISVTAWSDGGWGRSRPPRSAFYSWPEVCAEINRKDFGSCDDMAALDFVGIDDIGAENDDFKKSTEVLCRILSGRERKFTGITTNIEPAAWDQRFDERVADRLQRNSVIVDMSKVPSFATV